MVDEQDDIIQFNPGDKLTSEITNKNNLLLKKWALDNTEVDAYIDGKIAELNSTYSDQLNAINTQISSVNSQISNLNKLDNLKFAKKNLDLGIGKTSLSSYLPNDSKEYLVWLQADMYNTSSGGTYWEKAATDKMTTAQAYIQVDGDSGRAQRARILTVIPVGTGRYITISRDGTPSESSRHLVGYCRI